MINWHF